jgi:hypothetical protein
VTLVEEPPMRVAIRLFLAAALAAPLAPSAWAANVEPDPAWMTDGKCQAVCAAHMWWRNHAQKVVDDSGVCIFSLQSALRNERLGIAAHRRRDARTGNIYIAQRTRDLADFKDCVNQGIRRRNFNLYAEERGLSTGADYDDPGLSALYGELTLEGSRVYVDLGEGHEIGDYVEGPLSSIDGRPLRFNRAGGHIVGGNRFRVDWVTRSNGTRMAVNRVISLRTGQR